MTIRRSIGLGARYWAPALLMSLACAAPGLAKEEASFEIFGGVQADYIQDFNRVDPNWSSTLRPSKIATPAGQFGSDGQAELSVKQSRFGVASNLPVGDETVSIHFDFDLFGKGANAGETTFNLQNAYGEWRQILAGQTDTTFMDGAIFPDTIDYWGPAGMVFVRNPQIRWTPISGPDSFAVAIETPNNNIDVGRARQIDPGLARNLQADNKAPDLTAHYRAERDWGHIQLAAILRRLGYDTVTTPDNEPSGHATGWGFNLTGNLKSVGNDVLHMGVVYGHGIASYMNDGGVDLALECTVVAAACVAGTVKATAVPLLGVSFYYDHYWSDKFSSAIGYSQTRVDNLSGQESAAFRSGQYASVNLLWRGAKNVMAGAEALWGRREENGGQHGNDTRVQFTVQYKFSKKIVP